jgi:hypothetical protein
MNTTSNLHRGVLPFANKFRRKIQGKNSLKLKSKKYWLKKVINVNVSFENDHGIRGERGTIVEGYAYLLVKKCLKNH